MLAQQWQFGHQFLQQSLKPLFRRRESRCAGKKGIAGDNQINRPVLQMQALSIRQQSSDRADHPRPQRKFAASCGSDPSAGSRLVAALITDSTG